MTDRKGNGMAMVEFVERKRWLFLGLPFTFTKYTVKEEVITVNRGLLRTTEDDCYMYKVQDVQLNVSLLQRICKMGTVKCFTGDTTDKILLLENIRNAKVIKDFILDASEKARIKRRTMNTLNINADDMDDMDEE